MTPKRPTKRHIIGKMSKIKERVLKALRGNQLVNIMEAIFSAETLQARREWQDIFKVMKGKNLQPRVLYPARVSFRFDR